MQQYRRGTNTVSTTPVLGFALWRALALRPPGSEVVFNELRMENLMGVARQEFPRAVVEKLVQTGESCIKLLAIVVTRSEDVILELSQCHKVGLLQ